MTQRALKQVGLTAQPDAGCCPWPRSPGGAEPGAWVGSPGRGGVGTLRVAGGQEGAGWGGRLGAGEPTGAVLSCGCGALGDAHAGRDNPGSTRAFRGSRDVAGV